MKIRAILNSLTAAVFVVTATAGLAINEGDLMPAVSIKSSDTTTDVDWKGKVTILNFWATWCDACKVELKEMSKEFAPLYERSDVVVRYVSLDKDPTKAKSYLEEEFGKSGAVTSRIAYDSNFEAADKLGIDSFPMTLVLDKNSKVVKIQRGFKPGEASTAELLKVAQGL